MSEKLNINVQQLSFHRNGICGIGFHAVLFTADVDKERSVPMVGVVWDEPGGCAVLRIDHLSNPEKGVRFGTNSWRGDHFEPDLRRAIETQASDGSLRIGPFALPAPDVLAAELQKHTPSVAPSPGSTP